MATLLHLTGRAVTDANGNPYPAAVAHFYLPGTTTNVDTYTTAGLSVANTNPVISDASTGIFPAIYLAAKRYKVVIKDASANTLQTWEVVDDAKHRVYSADAPSPTYPGQEWVDTDTNVLSERNAANDAWIDRGDVDSGVNASSVTETITGTLATKSVTPDSLQGLLGKGSDLTPSGGTVSLPAGGGKHYNLVAGAVSAISTAQGGREVWLHCQGASELTHNATSFEIDGGGDYDTEAGDVLICVNKAATDVAGTNWRVRVSRKGGVAGIFPKGHIWGLTTSRAGTTTWSIAAGECANENTSAPRANLVLTSAITKSLSSWAVGTGNGGLDTGAVGANTWYHMHLIRKISDGSIDALCSLSPSAPTMPAGYEARRRVGSFLTNGSSQIVVYSQASLTGDEFLWDSAVIDVDDDNPGTSAVTRTLTVPTGVKVIALVSVGAFAGTGNPTGLLSALDVGDQAGQALGTGALSGFPSFSGAGTAAAGWGFCNQEVRTNTSAQVRSRLSVSGANDRIGIITRGWRDDRGRHAAP